MGGGGVVGLEEVVMMRGRERVWCTYIVVVAGVRGFRRITKHTV
jgi:hypothetical protein